MSDWSIWSTLTQSNSPRSWAEIHFPALLTWDFFLTGRTNTEFTLHCLSLLETGLCNIFFSCPLGVGHPQFQACQATSLATDNCLLGKSWGQTDRESQVEKGHIPAIREASKGRQGSCEELKGKRPFSFMSENIDAGRDWHVSYSFASYAALLWEGIRNVEFPSVTAGKEHTTVTSILLVQRWRRVSLHRMPNSELYNSLIYCMWMTDLGFYAQMMHLLRYT